ncbi:MAG: cytochrome c3 family protein [Longimicrobiales bacterium]
MRRSTLALLGAVGVVVLAVAGMLASGFRPPGVDLFDRGVEQPIAFPHDLHAGANQIPCMYCHYTADRSLDAGIPSVQLCVGCHAPGAQMAMAQPARAMVAADRPGVEQLMQYWNEKRPIEWVRIYDLPDHVHFPHMMHVNAGLECQQCHGAVEEMVEVEQVPSLQMGWCIDCHEQRQARIDCFVCHY